MITIELSTYWVFFFLGLLDNSYLVDESLYNTDLKEPSKVGEENSIF